MISDTTSRLPEKKKKNRRPDYKVVRVRVRVRVRGKGKVVRVRPL